MLQITIPDYEVYDANSGRIITVKGQTLQLEHSLVSISKWESKWKKPFISPTGRTREESIDYVRCMTITQNVNPQVYQGLTSEHFKQIDAYIDDPMTATKFTKTNRGGGRSVITNEVIYHWMITFEIPVEFQRWHLNRLLTLIRICEEKSQPGKKMSQRDIAKQNRALNAARKRHTGTRG